MTNTLEKLQATLQTNIAKLTESNTLINKALAELNPVDRYAEEMEEIDEMTENARILLTDILQLIIDTYQMEGIICNPHNGNIYRVKPTEKQAYEVTSTKYIQSLTINIDDMGSPTLKIVDIQDNEYCLDVADVYGWGTFENPYGFIDEETA